MVTAKNRGSDSVERALQRTVARKIEFEKIQLKQFVLEKSECCDRNLGKESLVLEALNGKELATLPDGGTGVARGGGTDKDCPLLSVDDSFTFA
ncbi:MAG: hypothetical protein ACTHXT_12215 [Sphingobacterium sp.]